MAYEPLTPYKSKDDPLWYVFDENQNFKTFDALNSFFSPKFQKNKQRQIIELSKYLNNWQSEKNLILVTHYVVILEKLNKAVSSGEIVVVDKNLNLIGSIKEY